MYTVFKPKKHIKDQGNKVDFAGELGAGGDETEGIRWWGRDERRE